MVAYALAALLSTACGTNTPPASVPAQAVTAILTATPYARPPQPIIVDPSGAIAGGQPNLHEVPYRVEAGDTLLGIANRFDTTVEAIVRRNNLPNASDLKIGQDLIVPTNAVVVATAVPVTTPTPAATATSAARTPTPISAATPGGTTATPAAAVPTATPAAGTTASGTPAPGTTVVVGGVRTYIVERGDTASGIANQFGVTTEALAQANNRTIAGLASIQPGDRLVIPPAR
jgi:LysM repeat protein